MTHSTIATASGLKVALAVLTTMLLLAGSADAAGAGLQVPNPTGPFHVGTHSIALTDASRHEPGDAKQARSLVIQLWYPAAQGGRRASVHVAGGREIPRQERGRAGPALLEGVKLDATADAMPLARKRRLAGRSVLTRVRRGTRALHGPH